MNEQGDGVREIWPSDEPQICWELSWALLILKCQPRPPGENDCDNHASVPLTLSLSWNWPVNELEVWFFFFNRLVIIMLNVCNTPTPADESQLIFFLSLKQDPWKLFSPPDRLSKQPPFYSPRSLFSGFCTHTSLLRLFISFPWREPNAGRRMISLPANWYQIHRFGSARPLPGAKAELTSV